MEKIATRAIQISGRAFPIREETRDVDADRLAKRTAICSIEVTSFNWLHLAAG